MNFRRQFIVLDDDAREALFEQDPSTAGDGGFQKFLVKLQGQYRGGSQELAFDDDDLERARRYAFDYGHGTWENRLRRIFGSELGTRPEPEE